MESPPQRRRPLDVHGASVAQLPTTASDVPWRVRGGHEGPEDQSGPSPLPCRLSLHDRRDPLPDGPWTLTDPWTRRRAHRSLQNCADAVSHKRPTSSFFSWSGDRTGRIRRETSRFLRFYVVSNIPARLQKGNVLGVAGCRARRFGDPLETQEVLLGGYVEHIGANRGSRRMLGELGCRDGEVEQEIDPKACLREEVRARRRIEAKPEGRDPSTTRAMPPTSTGSRPSASERPRAS